MTKKIIFLLALLAVLATGAIFYISKIQEKNLSPVLEKKVVPTSTARKMKEYIDPSGFKFKYPEDVTVSTKDISESNILYADLTITTKSRKGKITLVARDATKTFFDEELKDKTTIETKLDDIDAYQYQKDNKLITTAYDQGVQFNLTTDISQEKNYWFGVNKQILNSFEFVEPEQSTSTSTEETTASEEEIIFEGEEIIE